MTGNTDPSRDARRAAEQLGVELPCGFMYLGADQAMMIGTANDFRTAVAILNRIQGVPAEECWPPEPEPDPRPLGQLLAEWTEQRGGEAPPMWNMGYELRRWLADRLPPDMSSGERLVALEAADNAWDETRIASQADLLETMIRRTGYTDAKQLGKVLGKLAARGLELRNPVRKDGQIVTDKNGRTVFACKGHELELRIPTEEECPALKLPPAGDLRESSPQRGTFIDKAPPPGPKAPPPGPQSSPQRGTPTTYTSNTPISPLVVAEEVVRSAHAVALAEEKKLIGQLQHERPSHRAAALSEEFEAFWREYPRKTAKADAKKAFAAALKAGTTADHLTAMATKHRRHWEAEGRQANYIPYPATWLRRESYDDELTNPQPAAPQQSQALTYAERGIF